MKNSFAENSYTVMRNIIGKELTQFLFKYLKHRREVMFFLKESTYLSPFDKSYGTMDDSQIPGTYAHYGDMALDLLLPHVKEKIEKEIDLQLVENYTYARLYKRYDTLVRHIDRKSCEVSGTMMLGGDEWPIFLQDKNKKEIKVDLNPGDILLYRGCGLEHWREPFTKTLCAQVFIHYNEKTEETEKTKFDGRMLLGTPSDSI